VKFGLENVFLGAYRHLPSSWSLLLVFAEGRVCG
jgi:hypothetical protein